MIKIKRQTLATYSSLIHSLRFNALHKGWVFKRMCCQYFLNNIDRSSHMLKMSSCLTMLKDGQRPYDLKQQ